MTVILEDGTGVTDSNSYVNSEYVVSYLTDRGRIAEWAGSDAVKEAATIKATDYIEKRFSKFFLGTKSLSTQGLSWPRNNAIDQDGFTISGLPKVLKNATVEYAVRCLTSELLIDPSKPINSSGGQVASGEIKSFREKTGPLEEETQFVTSADGSGNRPKYSSLVDSYLIAAYPAADMLLETIIHRVGRLER